MTVCTFTLAWRVCQHGGYFGIPFSCFCAMHYARVNDWIIRIVRSLFIHANVQLVFSLGNLYSWLVESVGASAKFQGREESFSNLHSLLTGILWNSAQHPRPASNRSCTR